MRTWRVMLAAAVLLVGATVCGHAAVRSYNKLTLNERIALQESEQRLASYDQRLARLERERARHQISAQDYASDTAELSLVIREESLYQNAILVRSSDLPQRARDLLETLEHAALAVPVGIAYVIAACPQLLQFLTLIH